MRTLIVALVLSLIPSFALAAPKSAKPPAPTDKMSEVDQLKLQLLDAQDTVANLQKSLATLQAQASECQAILNRQYLKQVDEEKAKREKERQELEKKYHLEKPKK